MGKRQTVYLHIGQPKTGTSALQEFFYRNENVLAARGLQYINGSHLAGNLWVESADGRAAAQKVWDNVDNILRSSNDDVLVSNESLSISLYQSSQRVLDILKYTKTADVKVYFIHTETGSSSRIFVSTVGKRNGRCCSLWSFIGR